MSAPAAPLARPPAWLAESQERLRSFAVPVLRAVPFLALCAFATMHWTGIVLPAPTGRGLLVAVIATATGVLIAATARLPRLAGVLARIALLLLGAALASAAIGIRAKLFLPAHWGTLSDRVSGGLSVVGSVSSWPYAGPNTWLRLTTLLGAPLAAIVAAALAFWPSRRRPEFTGLRFAGLIPLVAIYVIALAARPFGQQGLRGLALLAALAAWLWLPRLRGRDALAALLAVAVAGLVGLGLTAKLASHQPWVDYKHWSWSLPKEKAITYDWRPRYGPLHWSRKGTTLMLIRSKKPHYWRAETLDRFDGYGWTTVPVRDATPSTRDLPQQADKPAWDAKVSVTVRALRSQVIVAPGTPYDITSDHQQIGLSDATYIVDGQLSSGDSYTVSGYVPDPSVKAMRVAPPADVAVTPSTAIELPGASGQVVEMPMRGVPGTGTPGAAGLISHSPYARTLELAQRLAKGASSNYDIVARVGSWLEGGYTYDERVPSHRYPLESFLFDDKAGYCQQFSGAAALMLRMDGIPARVATGFSPGTLNPDTKEYVVRDLDAHSWIEVWFEGIGWVPFDPTPAIAPAGSQAATFKLPSASTGNKNDRSKPANVVKNRRPDSAATAAGAGISQHNGTPWGAIALGVLALVLVVGVVVAFIRARRVRRLVPPPPCGDPDVDQLMRLLARLGLVVEPGTTLLALERRLGRLGGPEAAGYARGLRERRFGGNGTAPPDKGARRRMRQALADAVGAGRMRRLHLALPDGGPPGSGRFKLARRHR